MKLARLMTLSVVALLCLATNLVFAQDATPEPTAEATSMTNATNVQAQPVKHPLVTYGKANGEALRLDVYEPASSNTPRHAVILIHGGAGSFGDRSDMDDNAQGLATAGYVAFNIDYRLLEDGKNPWPAQLDDAQLAVRWIRANAAKYHVDPDRICSLGHSFGAQLAALLGVRDTPRGDDLELGEYSSHVACVVDMAGSVDARYPMLDTTLQPVVTALYGGTVNDVPDHYRDASPVMQVTADSAPFLIFHGANDEVVSVEESRDMVDVLHSAGVTVVYAEYPDATHFYWNNFFKATGSWDYIGPETLSFLGRHLKPAA